MKLHDALLIPAAGVKRATVTGHDGLEREDWLAEEVPVALVFNGVSHAVMMATPFDLEDFALGFALTEGLVASPSDVFSVEVSPACGVPSAGLEVQLHVSSEAEWRLRERRRTLAGRTGCGLCGTDSLDQVHRDLPQLTPVRFSPIAVTQAQQLLPGWQGLQRATGATHAAAWCNAAGEIVMVREDVGRHNALDKLIGALTRSDFNASAGFICVTSRASFEMVQKAAMANVALLAAVSAPTALAVDVANRCGLQLAGFVRGDRFVTYTYPERWLPGT